MNDCKKSCLYCEEPYRLFFPLGMLIAILGTGHWLVYALGWRGSYSGFFHSSVQIQGFMTCFVLGFLLTALPRFSGTHHATIFELTVFLFLTAGIVAFDLAGVWIAAEICFLLLLLFLGYFVAVRFFRIHSNHSEKAQVVHPPVEFVWIPVAILHGAAGVLLLILGQMGFLPAWAVRTGKPMLEQGFLLSIVAGIGGFLGPRLMGLSEAPSRQETCCEHGAAQSPGRQRMYHLALGGLLWISFWLEGIGAAAPAYGLRAAVVTTAFVRTRCLPRPPRVTDFFARLLWLSFWMTAAGLWLTALFPSYRLALLHITFVGGFSLMIFSVATMVTLSHAGEAVRLHHFLVVLWIVAAGVLAALVLRISAVFIPDSYFRMLGTASAVWIFAAVSWLCFVVPRFGRRSGGEEEIKRQHEAEKKRIFEIQHHTNCGNMK